MTPARVTYRESDHSYWLGRRQIPGITRVLKDLGYFPASRFFTSNSRDLGQAVHTACRLADDYAPDATSVDQVLEVCNLHPDLYPYLEGYLLFRREMGYRSMAWETPSYDPFTNVGGIPDTYGESNSGLAAVDIKTWKDGGTKPKRSAELQIAHYSRIIPLTGKVERWILKLPGNRRYRLYTCDNPCDFAVVNALAAVWWDQANSGVIRMSGDPEIDDEPE